MEGNRENVLLRGFTDIVSVAYSGDDFENPVEGENILGMVRFSGEVAIVLVGPRIDAGRVHCFLRSDVIHDFRILDIAAVHLLAKVEPQARANVVGVNDHQDEACEVAQVVLPLLRIASQQELHHVVQRLREPLNVDPSEELPPVLLDALSEV